jgi:hypothetical protein
MSKFFEKIFGKKKKEEVSNNQNNINEQMNNNQEQTQIQNDIPITFNQNMNIENQVVNPLGFQPTAPTNNIQSNLNTQEYNLGQQPTEINTPLSESQATMMNISQHQQLNTIPQAQPMQTPITSQPIMTSNGENNIVNQQPITFNPAPEQVQQQQGTLNVIPTLGATPNPIVPNQNNINNQNM